MAININGINGGNPAAGASDTGQVNTSSRLAGKTQKGTANTAGTDTISLTEVSRQLPNIERKLDALPVVDVQRVEAARQAISSGNYQINPANIARKFSQIESLLPA